jgi:hypothetical protein
MNAELQPHRVVSKTQNLISAILPDALKKGCTYVPSYNSDGSFQAAVLARFSKGKRPRLLAGVRIEPTGWATDLTVDLSVSRSFRADERTVRGLLGITQSIA